jgi:ribosome modulation factor
MAKQSRAGFINRRDVKQNPMAGSNRESTATQPISAIQEWDGGWRNAKEVPMH